MPSPAFPASPVYQKMRKKSAPKRFFSHLFRRRAYPSRIVRLLPADGLGWAAQSAGMRYRRPAGICAAGKNVFFLFRLTRPCACFSFQALTELCPRRIIPINPRNDGEHVSFSMAFQRACGRCKRVRTGRRYRLLTGGGMAPDTAPGSSGPLCGRGQQGWNRGRRSNSRSSLHFT